MDSGNVAVLLVRAKRVSGDGEKARPWPTVDEALETPAPICPSPSAPAPSF